MTGKAPPNLLAKKIDEGNVQDFQEVANGIEKGKGEDDPEFVAEIEERKAEDDSDVSSEIEEGNDEDDPEVEEKKDENEDGKDGSVSEAEKKDVATSLRDISTGDSSPEEENNAGKGELYTYEINLDHDQQMACHLTEEEIALEAERIMVSKAQEEITDTFDWTKGNCAIV